jgi:hypothetical protein
MRADPVRSRNSHQKTQTDSRNAQRAVRSHSYIGLSEPKRELLFIDQALKDRDSKEQIPVMEQQLQTEITQRRAQEQRTREENQQIEEVQASLSSETLEALRQEATQLVAQEYGKVEFGEQTLIRLKMEEMIRERYVIT